MVEKFAKEMLKLLEIERRCNLKELRPHDGSLINQSITEMKMLKKEISIWSGCLITFGFKELLPLLYIKKDDYVELNFSGNNEKIIGIVEEFTAKNVRIAFKPPIIGMKLPNNTEYKIFLHESHVVFKRMAKAMVSLQNYKRKPPNQLIEIFFNGKRYEKEPTTFALDESYWEGQQKNLNKNDFGEDSVQLIQSYSPISSEDEDHSDEVLSDEVHSDEVSPPEDESIIFFNSRLNVFQKEVVQFALNQREVAIIHGPPGTGKTTTLVEIILQLVKKNLKVLVCAPSNAAVDNLGKKLMDAQEQLNFPVPRDWMVRYGHYSRVHHDCAHYSLNQIVERHYNFRQIYSLKNKMNKLLNGRRRKQDIDLFKEHWKLIQSLTKRAIIESFKKSCIILTTVTSVSELSEYFNSVKFDLVVMDECSQGLEAASWLVLLRVNKCILAGDHRQLAPTVISKDRYVQSCLQVSLMERLLKLIGTDQMRMLTLQYRMHERIEEWPSSQFYDNMLKPHPSVATHLLSDLEGVEEDREGITTAPLVLIDTAGMAARMECVKDGIHYFNLMEASLVIKHVQKLIELGVQPGSISVISPYALQVKVLQHMLEVPEVEVNSIDGFQGRENEAIILSLVRSNLRENIGFLRDWRRMNVAVTRARRHLAVICDSKTIMDKGIIAHIQKVGLVIPAEKYDLDDYSIFQTNEAIQRLIEDTLPNNGYDLRQHMRPRGSVMLSEFLVPKLNKYVPKFPSIPQTNNNNSDDNNNNGCLRADDNANYSNYDDRAYHFHKHTHNVDRGKNRSKSYDHSRKNYRKKSYKKENSETFHKSFKNNVKIDSPKGCSSKESDNYYKVLSVPKNAKSNVIKSIFNNNKNDDDDDDDAFDNDSNVDEEDNNDDIEVLQDKIKKSERGSLKDLPKFIASKTTKIEMNELNKNFTNKTKSEVENVKQKNNVSNNANTEKRGNNKKDDSVKQIMESNSKIDSPIACSSKDASNGNKLNSKRKKSKSSKRSKSVKKGICDSDDEDAFLDRAINENKSCALDPCSNLDRMSFSCESCLKRYCILHKSQLSHNCNESTRMTKTESRIENAVFDDLDDWFKYLVHLEFIRMNPHLFREE